jgi:long-chain acyl-CoA synthetase
LTINLDETTLPKLLKSNAEKFGSHKTALREKKLGIWNSYSWQEYFESVRLFSLGLTALGLAKEDKVVIIGNNRPTSLYAEIATQAAGGVSVGLYQDATPRELAQVLRQFDVRIVVAEDQEQVDKVLEIIGHGSSLIAVIYCDPRGMRNYRHEGLASYQSVLQLGRDLGEREPDLFDRMVAQGKGDDIAIISTTSGATGPPKGTLLSHRNMLSMALSLNEVEVKRESDEFVSFLPLAWFGEQMMSLASALSVGFTVNFPEKPDTVLADLREIGPQIMFSPPRVWETIAATVQVKIMETTPFKRFMYTTFMWVGQKIATLKLGGRPVPFFWRLLNGVAYLCLFRALLDRLGLSRVRSALTGGSALGADVFTFFHAIGINLKQVYGLTEISGVACIHRDGDVRGDTVGLPLPGTEIRISATGEILARSAGAFRGYYQDDAATAAAFDEGWLRTGDAGSIDADGHLTVVDRTGDVMALSDGSAFAPQFAENKLKFSPYIKEAMVVGHARPFLTALICIDGRVVGKWAGDNKLNYTTFSNLATRAEVSDLLGKELAAVNQSLPEAAKISRYALLYKELDADDEELTRTGKMRRAVVGERYSEIIEAMYAGLETVPIDTAIELPDGKSARIQTTVLIRTLG